MTEWIQALFVHSSYYIIGALLVLWCYSFYRWVNIRSFTFDKRSWGYLCTVFCLVLLVWFGMEHGFKVLADESNLIAVSKSLNFDKTPFNVTQGQFYYENFWPITSEIPKRPLLYPFLVSIFHSLFGYSIANAFYVNGLAFLLLLSLLFFWIRSTRWGNWGGIAAALFVTAQPVVCVSASSAGYDLLASLLLIWSLYLVFRLCKSRDINLITLLWVSLILLANTRPESALFFPLILGLSFVFGLVRWEHVKANLVLLGTSLLGFLPRVLQIMLPHDYENPQTLSVIGVENFINNLPHLFRGLINLNFQLPYATFLNLAGLIILVIFLVKILLNKESIGPYRPFALISLGSVLAGLFIYVGHHFGRFDHPTQERFFLIFVMSLSLLPFLLQFISSRVRPLWLAVAGLCFFVVYFPVAREQHFVNSLTLIRKTKAVYEFFDKIKEKDVLVITDRPGIYTIRQLGAVNFTWALENREQIMGNLNRKLYQRVYVVEDIPFNSGISLLGSVFPMETVMEFQNTAQTLVRIAEVHP